jgi:hypothetical protein
MNGEQGNLIIKDHNMHVEDEAQQYREHKDLRVRGWDG